MTRWIEDVGTVGLKSGIVIEVDKFRRVARVRTEQKQNTCCIGS
jgi:hypothetical protein